MQIYDPQIFLFYCQLYINEPIKAKDSFKQTAYCLLSQKLVNALRYVHVKIIFFKQIIPLLYENVANKLNQYFRSLSFSKSD